MHDTPTLQELLHLLPKGTADWGKSPQIPLKKPQTNKKQNQNTPPEHTKLISVQTEDQDFKASQERQLVNSSDISQAQKHLPGIVFIYF